MEMHLLKLDLFICIFLVCSEPQQVFKYMLYLKSFFYNHILKCYSNNMMKPHAIADFQCAKLMLKVLSKILEPDILQNNICFYAGNKTRV